MPVITSIKPQKNGKRVNIYLNGKFGFGLDLQTFIKERIKVEQELTNEQVESIVKRGEFQDAYDKILMYASLRPRSKKEYDTWLKKHKVHKSVHEEIYKRLQRLDLLNDEKFAAWWIGQRQTFRPKAKRVLEQELMIKGVSRDVIKKTIAEGKIDEHSAAKRMISKKAYKWRKFEGYEKRQKIYAFLMQKGFNTEIIRDVLDEIDDI